MRHGVTRPSINYLTQPSSGGKPKPPFFNYPNSYQMNKGELVSAIADKSGLTKDQAESALSATLASIEEALKSDDSVSLVGFGTFSVNNRPAREGRNPRTNETIQIAAKNVVKFKPGKKLSESVN
ncbi:HU family DNA-binding protein [Neolewinella marina]|nr:HU family DNA-binding protein [Neolewinella marina]